MAEINHRYLQDNDGAEFFPITHIDAVQGLENDSTITDINNKVVEINETLTKANATISAMQKQLDGVGKDVVSLTGDTGWVDYAVGNADKNGGIKNGFNCMIREVSVGFAGAKNFRFRTIRVNIGNVPHNVQVGQLPNGFIDETVRFIPSVSSGHVPPTVSVDTQGAMHVFFPSEDRDGKQWVYGQHTWLVN
ncbi:MAG: hypothetical protein L0K90_02995 [Staphylococcus equorum]|nr:hypothetical protein [Staphylococcus equorum]